MEEMCKSTYPMPAECIPEKVVDYIGRPFPMDEADKWYGQLAELGFNSVRLITNWESIQPFRPGTCGDRGPRYDENCFDLEYLDYYSQIIAKAKDHGIYVLVDMHQDVFSRHLMAFYNEEPLYGDNLDKIPAEGTLEHIVLSMMPSLKTDSEGNEIVGGFTDWVRGHGAPRWVVETCLPEKDMNSVHWGVARPIASLCLPDGNPDIMLVTDINNMYGKLFPGDETPEWIETALRYISARCQGDPEDHAAPNETTDFLPITPWLVNGALSLDVDRCYAALFAGDVVFPNLVVDDDNVTKHIDEATNPNAPDLKAYLQGEYEKVWAVLAELSKDHDNVIGYDIMNEPVGIFLMLTLAGIIQQANVPDAIQSFLFETFPDDGLGEDIYDVIMGLNLLPRDTNPETLKLWGMDNIDTMVAVGMNMSFDAEYLQPFYERMGQKIQSIDPNAIIWFEPASSIRTVTGPSPFWDTPLTRPQGIDQLVYAPHWYPDIYPRPGIDSSPREFNADEWLYRDFTEPLKKYLEQSPSWLGNVPVIFGEFGTYFNFNGIEASIASDYSISSHVLNSYYEAFESLNVGSMLWCFAPDNDYKYGEHWNHEDFSIIDPNGDARGWPAYVRTHARTTSGKLIGQRFNSQYHFWDPIAGQAPPERTYTLKMHLNKNDAPSEIYVPDLQYPDGFYVWLSDGHAYFDDKTQTLYWYTTKKTAGTQHSLKIEPRLPDREAIGWSYFIQGDSVVRGAGDSVFTGLEVLK